MVRITGSTNPNPDLVFIKHRLLLLYMYTVLFQRLHTRNTTKENGHY